MAIFSDLVEDIMEIFMDDFSIFGDSFDLCLANFGRCLSIVKRLTLCSIRKNITLWHKKELCSAT